MKWYFCFLLFLALFQSPAFCQEMRYREAKQLYSWSEYHVRQQNPSYKAWIAGLSSFIVPGVGQMYTHEYLRGALFLGANTVTEALFLTGLYMAAADYNSPGCYNSEIYNALLVGCSFIALGLEVWSTADAIRIAKVKSYAYSQHRTKSSTLRLEPVLQLVPTQQTGFVPSLGAKMCLKF